MTGAGEGTAEIGGINNTSGVLKILDEKGKEIGRWDKDGVRSTAERSMARRSLLVERVILQGVIRILDGKAKKSADGTKME